MNTIPPHSNDAEIAVLGSLMMKPDLMPAVYDILPDKKAFYSEIHQIIYDTIMTMYTEKKQIDLYLLSEELNRLKKLDMIGNTYYLSQILSQVVTPQNCLHYAYIVKEYYIKRDLIKGCERLIQDGYDPGTDALDLLDHAEQNMRELALQREINTIKEPIDLAKEAYDKLVKMYKGECDEVVYSYISDLDNFTLGFQGGEFIVIAARPRMGKTALALTILRNNSIVRNIPSAILSLEMTDYKLWVRMASMETQISNSKFRKGELSQSELQKTIDFCHHYANCKLYIDKLSRLSSNELRMKASKYVKKFGIKLLVIDYLQLMTGGKSKENRNLELAEISRTCKEVATEYNIPVIALSQLNRDLEKRGKNRRAMLSDLRDSGAIEADADMVLFLDRPEADGILKFADGTSTRNMAKLILEKHRDGDTGECMLGFYKHRTMFVGMDKWHEQPVKDENDEIPF